LMIPFRPVNSKQQKYIPNEMFTGPKCLRSFLWFVAPLRRSSCPFCVLMYLPAHLCTYVGKCLFVPYVSYVSMWWRILAIRAIVCFGHFL
jgi:hypothetical protein